MTTYKGRALKSQPTEAELAKERWRLEALARHIEAGGSRFDEFNPDYGKDDGRGDEDHPDSGWCEAFNRSQRGET